MFNRAILLVLLGIAASVNYVMAHKPVGTSKVPISDWADLFTFTAEQVTGAMQAPVPPLPTAGSMGPGTIEALKTADRKLTLAEVKERSAVLHSFWESKYPTIPLASFQQWAQPIYDQYLTNLGLSDVAHFKEQGHHRAIILGMSTVSVTLQSSDTLQLRLNHFSVLDPSELRFWTGLAKGDFNATENGGQQRRRRMTTQQARRVLSTLPASYDMRSTGQMPPIRNQMQCGSCWAFTTSSTMEIQNMYVNGNGDVGELSEQEVVSCDTLDAGCDGGDPVTAWQWMKSNGGLTTNAKYPYEQYLSPSDPTPKCNSTLAASQNSALTAYGEPVFLPSLSFTQAEVQTAEAAIMEKIHAGYPVSFLVAASSACFGSYTSGVMTCSCGGGVDHVVLAIGWTPTYFIIRNQWFVLYD